MSAGTLLIRADASIEIGTGHVMRCLALAQAWQDAGGNAVFCQAQSMPSLNERLTSHGMSLVSLEAQLGTLRDATQIVNVALGLHAQWLVVDGYHFDAKYQKYLIDQGLRMLLVDDTGCHERCFADVVLNQNIDANQTLYPQYDGQLLLGPQYSLLRREFLSWRDWKRNPISAVHKILVTLGGSDPHNVTDMVINALSSLEDLSLDVIVAVGANNPHMDSLLKAKSQCASNIELRRDIPEMTELMAWADLAISAGGGTAYELIFFHVPAILITVADNQETVCQSLGKSKVAIDAGWFHAMDSHSLAKSVRALILDSELRRTLIENCQHLLDGKGAGRVVESMLSISREKMPAAELRRIAKLKTTAIERQGQSPH
jgi:UDP-2,4-diacetamido-2,4,6-trideoxy-beta-L-altropyranose hydrolase